MKTKALTLMCEDTENKNEAVLACLRKRVGTAFCLQIREAMQ